MVPFPSLRIRRYSKRYQLKPFPLNHRHILRVAALQKIADEGHKFDVVLNHLSSSGSLPEGSWPNIDFLYHEVISNVTLVTLLTEPRHRLVSYYYYYYRPGRIGKKMMSLEQWLASEGRKHTLWKEFGVSTPKSQAEFMATYAGRFDFILLSDRLAESLVAMALDLGWSVADVSYLRLLDSHTERGQTRFDGKRLEPTPRWETLSARAQEQLRQLTIEDQRFHDYASRRLDELIAGFGDNFGEVMSQYLLFQKALSELCACAEVSPRQREFCAW